MSTNRTVALWESAYNLRKLKQNGFNYCIAKSVIDSSGQLNFNMVWRSQNLAPRANITWTVEYGLNWTLDVPIGSAQITMGGDWQSCAPGQVYDVDEDGLWAPSSEPSKSGYLKVGKNSYRYGTNTGINIIVGVKTPEGEFEPVSLPWSWPHSL